MPTEDILADLAAVACRGLPSPDGGVRPLLDKLFGSRYQRRHFALTAIRDAYGLASEGVDDGVPFAGLIHPDNPPKGPYGGTSVVWFPTAEHGSLIDFGAGTRGLSPDEGILTRPGHRRRIASLRRHLAQQGVEAWSKPDPTALGVPVPKAVQGRFPGFERVFQRYGGEMYACAKVPEDAKGARVVLQAFFDLYAYERGYQVLKTWEAEYAAFHDALRNDLFPTTTAAGVDALLRKRRFVVLQGPPGTGKSRLADELRRQFFDGRGMTVQFHPAFTYEDFVVGLAPDATESTLRFEVRRGALLDAVEAAKDGPFLLHIDEVNRGPRRGDPTAIRPEPAGARRARGAAPLRLARARLGALRNGLACGPRVPRSGHGARQRTRGPALGARGAGARTAPGAAPVNAPRLRGPRRGSPPTSWAHRLDALRHRTARPRAVGCAALPLSGSLARSAVAQLRPLDARTPAP